MIQNRLKKSMFLGNSFTCAKESKEALSLSLLFVINETPGWMFKANESLVEQGRNTNCYI